jgi:site-specific DNA-methyltransferase (cytosine-N4-specific)
VSAEIRQGEALAVLRTLPAASVQTCITSPPYFGLRSYLPTGHADKALELGTEATLADYVARLVAVLEEIRRVLRPDGTLWLNLADSYAGGGGFFPDAPSNRNGGSKSSRQDKGSGAKVRGIRSLSAVIKPKNLLGVPWRVAFALQDAGWWLRSDIIWHKPNPMPESVTDRPTRAHEYLFLLSKSANYYYDADAIREPHAGFRKSGPNAMRGQVEIRPRGNLQSVTEQSYHPGGRNKRSVWTIATAPYPEAHFATFPEALVEPCILAGTAEGDTVLDPFAGSGTVLAVATRLRRRSIGIELNPDYLPLIERRIRASCPEARGQGVLALEEVS